MRKRALSITGLFGWLGMLAATPAIAADPVFTFAPPPVTYETIQDVGRITFVSADFGNDTMTGFGFGETNKEDSSQSSADVKASSASLFYLTADNLSMLSGDFGWRSEYNMANSDVVGFHGVGLGVSMLSIDLAGNDYTNTLTVPMSVVAGIQNKFSAGDNTVITPYVYALATLTPTSTNSFIGSVSSTSSDSFTSTGVVFGFDVLFDGMSLSAMLSSGENDILMFSFGFPMK